jgi:hypothetical protein
MVAARLENQMKVLLHCSKMSQYWEQSTDFTSAALRQRGLPLHEEAPSDIALTAWQEESASPAFCNVTACGRSA